MKLLDKLKDLHLDYYRIQLGVRQERDKVLPTQNGFRRSLVDTPGSLLGNAASYIDRLLYFLRTTPNAFVLMLGCTPLKNPQLDLFLETIMFSFFEDLVNTETSEIDLLMTLKEMVVRELGSSKQCSEIFSENSPNITGKLLIMYTHRRSQRRFIKLMLKQTLIRIINTDDRTLHLDSRKIYREVKQKRKWFYANSFSLNSVLSLAEERFQSEQHSDEDDVESLSNLDEEVSAILSQMAETVQKYCLLMLDAVYNSLEKMPFTMRWLCRVVSSSILNRAEKNTERDRNITLGAWVFTKWILVSVQSADLNGLLWDTQVTETNIANFGLIGRVIRHIYEEVKFEDEQFASLNPFVLREM